MIFPSEVFALSLGIAGRTKLPLNSEYSCSPPAFKSAPLGQGNIQEHNSCRHMLWNVQLSKMGGPRPVTRSLMCIQRKRGPTQ